MNTLGWLLIMLAVFLIQAAFRGQVFDSAGQFVLLKNFEEIVTALITGNKAKLDKLASGAYEPTPEPIDPASSSFNQTGPDTRDSKGLPKVWAKNPNTVDQALAWCAKQQKGLGIWPGRCLAYVARAYGLVGSGTTYAIDVWTKMPANMKHPGELSNIPTGALLFYRTGKRAGHVALYAGGGKAWCTDILRRGYGDLVDLKEITNGRWKLSYVGWTPPYFPDSIRSKIDTNAATSGGNSASGGGSSW